MLCKKPFCRTPTGTIKALAKVNQEARMAVVPFPCGQCLHCRLNMSYIWANRIMLEKDLYDESLFVTLTYNEENVPKERGAYTLKSEDFTRFLKKLRRNLEPKKIRYFGVGEYGDQTNRPHYHLALFNMEYADKEALERAWKRKGVEMGFVHIIDLNWNTARYISGYIVEKLLNRGMIDIRVENPFMRASRGNKNHICEKYKGGIGYGAAKWMAFKLNQNEFFDKRIIQNVTYGTKERPLGRYLSRVIADEIGISEEEWRKQADCFYDDLLEEVYGQVTLDNAKPQEDKAITYYESIRNRWKQNRVVKEARHKIYKQKRRL